MYSIFATKQLKIMTNRKQLHNWMKENHFLQSDYQKIRDLYFETFQQVLPFRISVGNVSNAKAYGHFRYELERLGFTNNGDPCGAMGNVGQCSGCGSEYLKKDKDDVTFAKCSFNDDGNLVVDKISIRQSLEVPELDINQFGTPGFSFTLESIPSEDLLNLFFGASKQTYTRPGTEKEVQLLLSELQKAGKIWNADKKQIEDDKRINVDKIDFKKCLADKDFTPYFPTKEIQDMVREWDNGICCLNGFIDEHKELYSKTFTHRNCIGVQCIGSVCPFCKYNSKSILLSIKPFAKELTDKEKFDKWRDDNGYSALVNYNEKQDKLSRKLSAINMICLCAKYLNGDWKLDLSTSGKDKNKRYFIYSTLYNDGLDTHSEDDCCSKGHAYFKTEELALKAIDILGEDLIKSAFSSDF